MRSTSIQRTRPSTLYKKCGNVLATLRGAGLAVGVFELFMPFQTGTVDRGRRILEPMIQSYYGTVV